MRNDGEQDAERRTVDTYLFILTEIQQMKELQGTAAGTDCWTMKQLTEERWLFEYDIVAIILNADYFGDNRFVWGTIHVITFYMELHGDGMLEENHMAALWAQFARVAELEPGLQTTTRQGTPAEPEPRDDGRYAALLAVHDNLQLFTDKIINQLKTDNLRSLLQFVAEDWVDGADLEGGTSVIHREDEQDTADRMAWATRFLVKLVDAAGVRNTHAKQFTNEAFTKEVLDTLWNFAQLDTMPKQATEDVLDVHWAVLRDIGRSKTTEGLEGAGTGGLAAVSPGDLEKQQRLAWEFVSEIFFRAIWKSEPNAVIHAIIQFKRIMVVLEDTLAARNFKPPKFIEHSDEKIDAWFEVDAQWGEGKYRCVPCFPCV